MDDSPSPVAPVPSRATWRESLAVMAVLFVFYLATSSREWPRGDAGSVYSVANSIVERHTLATNYAWHLGDRTRDGRNYSQFPLMQSLIHVPGEWVRVRLAGHDKALGTMFKALASNLATAFFGALTCMLFLRTARDLGAARWAALVGTGALAVGTFLWIFAHSAFVESLHCAGCIGLFGAMAAFDRQPLRRHALAVGAWAGVLFNAKLVYAAALPAVFLLPLVARRPLWPTFKALLWSVPSFAPFAALVLFYNWFRFGSVLKTGYGQVTFFSTPALHGLWGMFFSPNKSLFIFAPPLILSVVVFPAFARRFPRLCWLMAGMLLPVFYLYAKLPFWSGDWSWGPRYELFAVPVLLLPAVVFADRFWPSPGWVGRWLKPGAAVAVLAAGLAIQTIGVSFCWDNVYTIGRRVQWNWLGRPNPYGSMNTGFFEDYFAIDWLAPFNPVEMNLWFARHVIRGHTWAQSEMDAPWRAYVAVPPMQQMDYWWGRVGWDWWFPHFRGKFPRLAWSLLGVMTTAQGLALWWLVRVWRLKRGGKVSDSIHLQGK